MKLWHVIISIPGLDTHHFFLSKTKPTDEQLETHWKKYSNREGDDNYTPLTQIKGKYPQVARIVELPFTTLE